MLQIHDPEWQGQSPLPLLLFHISSKFFLTLPLPILFTSIHLNLKFLLKNLPFF